MHLRGRLLLHLCLSVVSVEGPLLGVIEWAPHVVGAAQVTTWVCRSRAAEVVGARLGRERQDLLSRLALSLTRPVGGGVGGTSLLVVVVVIVGVMDVGHPPIWWFGDGVGGPETAQKGISDGELRRRHRYTKAPPVNAHTSQSPVNAPCGQSTGSAAWRRHREASHPCNPKHRFSNGR